MYRGKSKLNLKQVEKQQYHNITKEQLVKELNLEFRLLGLEIRLK